MTLTNTFVFFSVTSSFFARAEVHGIGSALAAVVYQKWFAEYRTQLWLNSSRQVSFFYEPAGSGRGKCSIAGTCPGKLKYVFAGSDTPLSEQQYELKPMLQMFPVLVAPIMIVHNIPQRQLNLTRENIVDILMTNITQWNDRRILENNLELEQAPAKPIKFIARMTKSGQTAAFTALAGSISPIWKKKYGTFSTSQIDNKGSSSSWPMKLSLRFASRASGIFETFSDTDGSALSYMGLADTSALGIQAASLQNKYGNWLSASDAATGSVEASLASLRNLDNRLSATIVDMPTPTSWPLCTFTYHIVDMASQNISDCNDVIEYVRFVLWFLTSDTAAQLAKNSGLQVVHPSLSQRIVDKVLKRMTCKGSNVFLLAMSQQISQKQISITWNGAYTLPVILMTLFVVALTGVIVSMVYLATSRKWKRIREFTKLASGLKAKSAISRSFLPSQVGVRNEAKLMCSSIHTTVIPDDYNNLTKREMYRLSQLKNGILPLVGFTLLPPETDAYVMFEFDGKKTLYEALHGSMTYLDETVRKTLVKQLFRAVEYLHIRQVVHGMLCLDCCHLDSNYTLKLGDWVQSTIWKFQGGESEVIDDIKHALDVTLRTEGAEITATDPQLRFLYFVDPWLLTANSFSTSNDIYSCALIACVTLAPAPFRQCLSEWAIEGKRFDAVPAKLPQCWLDCIAHQPHLRPSMKTLISELAADRGVEGSVVKILITRLEEHVTNLEDMVTERVNEVASVNGKMQQLLSSLLPPRVATQLANGEVVEPQIFPSATVVETDIAGFTSICGRSTPQQIINFLNQLFSTYDRIVAKNNAYKVETVGKHRRVDNHATTLFLDLAQPTGDAYLACTGIPDPIKDHAFSAAEVAIAMVEAAKVFRFEHLPDQRLRIRAGVASGSVIAGIIGQKTPRYSLFGETVETAARLESTGQPDPVHVAAATAELMQCTDNGKLFDIQKRLDLEHKRYAPRPLFELGSIPIERSSNFTSGHKFSCKSVCHTGYEGTKTMCDFFPADRNHEECLQ